MNIDYFREFAVLAQAGSYLSAADQLYITQSTLTRHIQAFEKELGVSVFDRTTRRVTLTEYGELMLPYAQKIMRIQQEYQTDVYHRQRLKQEHLKIGAIPMMDSYGITDLLVSFQKEHPSASADITESDTSDLLKMTADRECDFAFIRRFAGEYQSEEVNCIPFSKDIIVAVIPESHPLSGEKTVSFARLKDTPLLLLAKETFLYGLCISECHKAGFDPVIPFTSHHAGNLLDLAKKGEGIALLTEKPILKYDLSGVSVADIRPTIETSIDLAYLPETVRSKTATCFLNYVKKHSELQRQFS